MDDDLDMLDFEKDMPLAAEDIRALNASRRHRVDPKQLKWEVDLAGSAVP